MRRGYLAAVFLLFGGLALGQGPPGPRGPGPGPKSKLSNDLQHGEARPERRIFR